MLQARRKQGFFHNLVSEMRLHDTESFINYHRMDYKTFEELLGIVGPSIKNKPFRQQEEINAAERLSLTLRYLASGDSMRSIGFYGYRIGASTTSYIIRETCQTLWEKLDFVLPTISTQLWQNVADEFYKKWDFPNCVGAIDGKHVVIQALPNYNSLTFNYKNSHSLILLAICDAEYKFVLVDIGALGHNSDGQSFRNSSFGKAIISNSNNLHLPSKKLLPGSMQNAPYVFVADEVFPLLKNLMRPYPGRSTGNLPVEQNVFNYRLSKARRVIENAFGILTSRWRTYRKPIIGSKATVTNIIKATICLHNFLCIKNSTGYITEGLVDHYNNDESITPGSWRDSSTECIQSIGHTSSNNSTQEAKQIRTDYTNYFVNSNSTLAMITQ